MLQYTNFKLALLAAADTEPGTVYSHPFEEGLYVVPETRAEEQRLVDAGVVLAEVEPLRPREPRDRRRYQEGHRVGFNDM